ncbi:ATP-binding protein [Gloeothece verrucosa]|uniref:Circadian input-output histidine kinase CikA n=1 Tax=Gloeothece verrucosa (strain PCC 7822) TaxID=497965 RepID=E0UDR4_GLOV7|nr:ATP-binding protein [Gloeothece verrucosa]ADN16499.1 GAF sensor signal transduction histidine kinase [Gloeothece verrucosa PCC 7822]
MTNVLQSTTEVFQEVFGVTQSLLLLMNAEKKGKIGYGNHNNPHLNSLLKLSCQLIEKNQSYLLQRKFISWTPTADCPLSLTTLAEQAQVSSLLIIPLYYQQSYLGELCLVHQQDEHQWTEKEFTIIRHLAHQCALSIYYIQQYQHQSLQQQLIKQINEKLNSQQDPEIILKDLLKLVGQSYQVEQVLLLSLEANELKVEQEWTINPTNFSLQSKKIALDEWIALLDNSCKKELDNYSNHWQTMPTVQATFLNLETRSVQPGVLVSVPVHIREKFFGVLVLQSIQTTLSWTREELETLSDIAQQTALAIHHLQYQDQWLTQQIEKLEAQKQQLEFAKKKTSEFLDHTIHELRSPLTGILSFSQILHEQIYGSLNAKQSQYVDVIVSSGQYMLSLVNDFLDLSKISAQREEIVLEAMAVEDVCLAALAMVEVRAVASQLTLKLDIAPDVDFCKADQRRIKQILVNLLTNAIKFTEKGSVTLKVERKQDYLDFSVIDTGIGIKTEDQNKLFQPFQQIKNHLSRKHKGTGLGLALSRQLAQLHGGDITLVSQEGQGSCFTLHLPI